MAWPPPDPVVNAPYACLIDCSDGSVLWSRSPDTQHSNASTTKWMSVLLICKTIQERILENINHDRPGLEQIVTVDASHIVGGSSGGLLAGDQLTLEDALHAAIKVSANDAITAAAGQVGYQYFLAQSGPGTGSTAYNSGVQAFVGQMNILAAELGLTNSHFVNPSGLDAAGHYMCARDLARLAAYAVTFSLMLDIWGKETWRTLITRNGQPFEKVWDANIATWNYPGGMAAKAGNTATANAVAQVAQRGNTRLAAAFIHGPTGVTFDADMRAMLDYGFRIKREYAEGVFKYGDKSGAINYPAQWQRSGYFPDIYADGYIMYTLVAATATISFRGSRVQWITQQGQNRGKTDVYLDGHFDVTKDLYNPVFTTVAGYEKDFGVSGTHQVEIRALGTRNAASSSTVIGIDYVLFYESMATDSLVSGAIVEGADTVAGGISISFPVDPASAAVIHGGWQEPDETVIGAVHFEPPAVPVTIPTPSQSCQYRLCYGPRGWCIYGVGSEFFHIEHPPDTDRIVFGKTFARGDAVFGSGRTLPEHVYTDWAEEAA